MRILSGLLLLAVAIVLGLFQVLPLIFAEPALSRPAAPWLASAYNAAELLALGGTALWLLSRGTTSRTTR